MTRFWVDVGRGSKAAVPEEMPAGDDGAFQGGSGRRRHEHGSRLRSGAGISSRLCGLVEPNRSGKDGRDDEIDELDRRPSMAAAATTDDWWYWGGQEAVRRGEVVEASARDVPSLLI
jgi:hypothetical protein